MIQMIELLYKDIKRTTIILFNVFKKLEKTWNQDMEDIFKNPN